MKDKECGKPSLLPGDIVKSKETGNMLVIEKAQVTINGSCINWTDDLPKKIEHGWKPSYAAQCLPGYKEEKHAWWYLEELELVEYGPLHKYLKREK